MTPPPLRGEVGRGLVLKPVLADERPDLPGFGRGALGVEGLAHGVEVLFEADFFDGGEAFGVC